MNKEEYKELIRLLTKFINKSSIRSDNTRWMFMLATRDIVKTDRDRKDKDADEKRKHIYSVTNPKIAKELSDMGYMVIGFDIDENDNSLIKMFGNLSKYILTSSLFCDIIHTVLKIYKI